MSTVGLALVYPLSLPFICNVCPLREEESIASSPFGGNYCKELQKDVQEFPELATGL